MFDKILTLLARVSLYYFIFGSTQRAQPASPVAVHIKNSGIQNSRNHFPGIHSPLAIPENGPC